MYICRFCGSNDVLTHFELPKTPLYMWPCEAGHVPTSKPLQLNLCNDCDLLQTAPLTNFELKEIYSGQQFNLENIAVNRNRFELVSKHLGSLQDGAKFLELGGGRNAFLPLLPANVEKTIVDFSVLENVKTAVDKYFEDDFLSVDLEKSCFDGFFLFHVLEHLEDPLSTIKKIALHIKSDGRVFIEVPNFAYDCVQQPHYALFHMHLSMFTIHTLLSLMDEGGFYCEHIFQEDAVIFASFKKGAGNKKKWSNCGRGLKQIEHFRTCFANCERLFAKALETTAFGDCAIFGGGGSANLFLYAYPKLGELVRFAIDSDKAKQGLYLFDGKVKIISVDDAKRFSIKRLIVIDKSHLEYAKTLGFDVVIMEVEGKDRDEA